MTKIITVKVSKGGVGKTTITSNLGYLLSKKNLKTLLIDFDSQSNLSKIFIKEESNKLTSSNLLGDEINKVEDYLNEINENLYIISSDIGLHEVSKFIEQKKNYNNILIEKLNKINNFKKFDYIILDLPPGVADTITQIALFSSDLLICPCHFDIDSLTGLVHTISDIYRLQEAKIIDEKINYLIVPNRYDKRFKKDNEQIFELLYENIDKEFIAKPIRENSHIKKARMQGECAIEYETNENKKTFHKKAVEDFEELYKKIIKIFN